MNFLETMMKQIVCEGMEMPKIQVERTIGSILEIFIESFMNELAVKGKIDSGTYKLIAPEFPIRTQKKEKGKRTNRSTNIDYLMLNECNNILYFIELKTDSGSFKNEQYENYREIVKNKNSKELFKFLKERAEEGKSKKKYEYMKEKVNEIINEDQQNKKREFKLIYILPKNTKIGSEKKFGKIHFEDLHNNNSIDHEFSAEWKIITSFFKKLDKN